MPEWIREIIDKYPKRYTEEEAAEALCTCGIMEDNSEIAPVCKDIAVRTSGSDEYDYEREALAWEEAELEDMNALLEYQNEFYNA